MKVMHTHGLLDDPPADTQELVLLVIAVPLPEELPDDLKDESLEFVRNLLGL